MDVFFLGQPGAEKVADATLVGERKEYMAELQAVPLLVVDDLAMPLLSETVEG